jgi:hypothetical protein
MTLHNHKDENTSHTLEGTMNETSYNECTYRKILGEIRQMA